jgi:hypothetical protein
VILNECEVTVAEDESGIVAFLARQGEEIRLLYTRPGIGAHELWCFQANDRARRFYEARGFRAIRFTDGAQNEEQMPDIRYRWESLAKTRFQHQENSEAGARGRRKMPEGFGPAGQFTGVNGSSATFDSNRWSAMFPGTSCLRRCADVGQADRH